MNPLLIATDGGVMGTNPSKTGGAWAYVHVDCDGSESWNGLTFPDEGVYDETRDAWVVSNNLTELIAMVQALWTVPEGWYGRVISDSMITLRRITNLDASMNGIPDWLVKDTATVRRRINLDRCTWQLVAGHPTKVDLARGYRMKGSKPVPVSIWNKVCDELCTKAMHAFTGG